MKLSIERLKEISAADDGFLGRGEGKTMADELIALHEALKAEQVPVAEMRDFRWAKDWHWFTPEDFMPVGTKLFTAPQKPVISKEKLCDWLEDEFDITNGQRDALAADFAHCCDCIVSDNKAIDALTNL